MTSNEQVMLITVLTSFISLFWQLDKFLPTTSRYNSQTFLCYSIIITPSPLRNFASQHIYFQAGSLKHILAPPLQEQHTKHAASSNSVSHLPISNLLSTSAARNPHTGPFSFCMTEQNQSEMSCLLHLQIHTTNTMQHNTLPC